MVTDERALLLSSLTNQRDHVLSGVEGLSEEDLRRPLLPTGWSCLSLVHHLALDVERFWFRSVVAGEPGADSDGEGWQVPAGLPGPAVLDLYRAEIERANAVIESTALDAPPAAWPEEWPNWRLSTVGEIVLYVITETACHAGHLDVVRELIDGRTWLILTD